MDNMVIKYVIILLIGVFIGSISQVLLKKAAMKKYDSVIKEYMNPLVIFAYILFFGTTLISIFAYRGIPLSWGPVLETTSYLYVTFFGVKIFGEKMNRKKIVGLILIVLGVVIYAFA